MLGDINVTHPAEIGVDKAVRAREQASRLRGRVFAQLNYCRECSQKNQQTEQNWEASPEAHVGMGKNDSRWRLGARTLRAAGVPKAFSLSERSQGPLTAKNAEYIREVREENQIKKPN
jgi:hypothetical protein